MTPSVAAGRALYLLEHPGVDLSVWDLTDEPTRDWYVTRAQPIVDAVAAPAWDEGYTTGNAHNGRRDANPYRKKK